MNQPVVKEVVQKIDCDKLSNKLKNDLMTAFNTSEQMAAEQAEKIAAIFRKAQLI